MSSVYGFKESYDLWQHVKKTSDANLVIIDSDDLLHDPKQMLQQYCKVVNIHYSNQLLHWQPGPGEVVAKDWRISIQQVQGSKLGGWYEDAFATSGWEKGRVTPSRSELSADVLACADAVIPCYEEMYNARMVPKC